MVSWSVMEDECNMALVLSDHEGRRAWFSYGDLAKLGAPPPRTRYSAEPFAGLLWAIRNGLAPYKTEGNIKGIPAPAKRIEHAS